MNGNGKKYKNGTRMIFGMSRSEKRANNNLGIVLNTGNEKSDRYRSPKLCVVQSYLEGTQYDGKQDWDQAACSDTHVPLKDRKPKIIYPFAKVFADRLSSKLLGRSTFPAVKVEDDEDTSYFTKIVLNGTFFQARMLDMCKKLVAYNSCFVRFKMTNGSLKLEKYNPNYCYPSFDPAGNLDFIEIKYVYDTGETDNKGKKIERWYKLILSTTTDTLFSNPIYVENSKPEFEVVSSIEHNLGYVQGEWFSIGEDLYSPDGESEPFILQIKDFVDAINYNLSQTDTATNYGNDPQLVLSGMDEDDIDKLIKSSAKAWALGREGKAAFLEVAGSGLEASRETREDFFKRVQDIARIVMLDPEKMQASAQSGKAMEVMHAPLVELVNEIRPWIEKGFKSLIAKMIDTIITLNTLGFETQFTMPEDFVPASMEFTITWPPVFELTTQDKQQVVSIGLQASNGNIISRDTALKWIQSQGVDFGVEDFELERQKVDSQKTFGGFF